MPTDDHLALLGATFHVTREGAGLEDIRKVVATCGGDASVDAVSAAIRRLLDAKHLESHGERYRASAGVIGWFGRTHRCYSGIAADAENVREYLERN